MNNEITCCVWEVYVIGTMQLVAINTAINIVASLASLRNKGVIEYTHCTTFNPCMIQLRIRFFIGSNLQLYKSSDDNRINHRPCRRIEQSLSVVKSDQWRFLQHLFNSIADTIEL